MRTYYTIEQLHIIAEEAGYKFDRDTVLATCTYEGATYYAELEKNVFRDPDPLTGRQSRIIIKREIIDNDGKAYMFKIDASAKFLKPLKWSPVVGSYYGEKAIVLDDCFRTAKAAVERKIDYYKSELETMNDGET